MSGAGKGDRPRRVIKSLYDLNYSEIFKRPMPCPVCSKVKSTPHGLECPLAGDSGRASHDTAFLKDEPLSPADIEVARQACRHFSHRV